jgi:hypothetical protein
MTPTGFEFVEFTQPQLHAALREMCPAALKAYDAATTKQMRTAWSPMSPTRFCCYFVSEMVYWHTPAHLTPMALVVPGDSTLHRFLIDDYTGKRVDLTCDQFDFELDYTRAVKKFYLQTGCTGPSKRAAQLANILQLRRYR